MIQLEEINTTTYKIRHHTSFPKQYGRDTDLQDEAMDHSSKRSVETEV